MEPAGPPPRQNDGQLHQSQRGVPLRGQSARPRGGAPLTSRPLPSSMGPAAAAPGGPAAAHPRLEPRSASFSQSLQCSWSFSSADGRGGLARGRLAAVSLSSAILKRGLGACRTPATRRAAIGRRAAGHAGTGSLPGHAGAGRRRDRDHSSRRPLRASRGGAAGAGGYHTGAAARGRPPRRRTAARPSVSRPPLRPRCLRSHPLPAREGGSTPMSAAPIGWDRDPTSYQPIGPRDTALRVKPGRG